VLISLSSAAISSLRWTENSPISLIVPHFSASTSFHVFPVLLILSVTWVSHYDLSLFSCCHHFHQGGGSVGEKPQSISCHPLIFIYFTPMHILFSTFNTNPGYVLPFLVLFPLRGVLDIKSPYICCTTFFFTFTVVFTCLLI